MSFHPIEYTVIMGGTAERANGRRAHESLLVVNYPITLNAAEHLANGSQPPSLRMKDDHLIPHGIIDGLEDSKVVIELRSKQNIIPAQDVSVHFFGPEGACVKTIALRLTDLDPVNHRAEGLPSLFGVFVSDDSDCKFGRLVTDSKELQLMGLVPDAVQSYLTAKVAAWVNGAGSRET